MASRGNRKNVAAWGLTILATVMLAVPTLATAIATLVGWSFTWTLITETTWAAVITLTWSGYFASNVVEKHKSFMSDAEHNHLEQTVWTGKKEDQITIEVDPEEV